MVDALSGHRTQGTHGTRDVTLGDAALPDTVTLGSFLLSQSGLVMPENYGERNTTRVVPPGRFDRLEITRVEVPFDRLGERMATFFFDGKGVPIPNTQNPPMGDQPYRLTLVDKEGNKWSGVVDISSKRTGHSHPGSYDTIKGLKLERELPPSPPPPAEIDVGTFMLSQSGALFPKGYGEKNPVAMFPPGFADHIEITPRYSKHATARFDVDERGVPVPNSKSPPLGDVPYTLTVVDKDGNRYSANVDVSSRTTGVRHSGYDDVKDLKLTLEAPNTDARAEAMDGVAAEFAKKTSMPATGSKTIADVILRR